MENKVIVIDSDSDSEVKVVCEYLIANSSQEILRVPEQTSDNRQHFQPNQLQPNTYRSLTQSVSSSLTNNTLNSSNTSQIFTSQINQDNPLRLTVKKIAKPSDTTPKRIATVQPVCKQPQSEVKTVFDNNEDLKKKPKLESQSISSFSCSKDIKEKILLPYRQKLKESTQNISKNGVVEPSPVKKRCNSVTLQNKVTPGNRRGVKPKSSRGTEPQSCQKNSPLREEPKLNKYENQSVDQNGVGKPPPVKKRCTLVTHDKKVSPGNSRGIELQVYERNSPLREDPEIKKNKNESNRSYIRRLISELVKVCAKGQFGNVFPRIKRKFDTSIKEACDETIDDSSVADYLERAIFDIHYIVKQNDYDFADKLRVFDKIKYCISKINRGSVKTNKKLRKLYALYGKLNRRILKYEEMEVTSDNEDEENSPYLFLDRYTIKATEVYKRICFLEGRSSIANRDVHQQFIYTGNVSAPNVVIEALQKHYNKTKLFPNWLDTYKLFQEVVLEQKLKYTDSQIYTECKELFQDFGKKLQIRRQRDDYSNIIGYLEDEQKKDPAENDPDLLEKLAKNRKDFRKKEANILDEFAFRSEREEDEMKELEDEKNRDSSSDEENIDFSSCYFLASDDSDSD